MGFTKITDSDRSGKGTVGMADTPNLTAAEMQAKFDELSNLAIEKFNVHVDEESGTSAAANIGAVDPTGGSSLIVQGVLDNLQNNKQEKETGKGLSANDFTDTYKTELDTAYENSHAHANKSVLDLITSTVKTAYDRLVTLFTSITSITTTVNGSDTALPTAGAISRYVQQMGGGDMVKSIYDTDNDGIVDHAEVAESLSNPIEATAVTYDHTASGLSAQNAQAAIDEVHNEAKNSVQTSAIENDLLGTDATKVLAAPQGKILDGKITTINSNLTFPSGQGNLYADYQSGKFGVNTSPTRGADTFHPFKADPIVHSATSASNTVTVEIGKEYIISAAIVSGYSITSMSLSNCAIISSTSIVQSGATNSRNAWLKTFYVKATGATLTLSWSVATGGANSTLQAITCLEL